MRKGAGDSLVLVGGEYSFPTNVGTINISSAVSIFGPDLANNGALIQSDAGATGGGSGLLNNNAGGVYQIQNDNGVSVSFFNNSGLLGKTGGSGTSRHKRVI
jgi:hypothetical protein